MDPGQPIRTEQLTEHYLEQVVGLMEIFKEKQDPQNCRQAEDKYQLTCFRIDCFYQPEAGHISDSRYGQKHDNVFRIPAHIKQVAANKEQDPTPPMRKNIKQGCDDREKYKELKGIKFQGMLPYFAF